MMVRCKRGRKSVEYDMHWPKEQTMSQFPVQTPKLQAVLALRYPYNTLDPNLTRGSVQLRKRRSNNKRNSLVTKALRQYLLLRSTGPPGSRCCARLIVVPSKVSVVAEFSVECQQSGTIPALMSRN